MRVCARVRGLVVPLLPSAFDLCVTTHLKCAWIASLSSRSLSLVRLAAWVCVCVCVRARKLVREGGAIYLWRSKHSPPLLSPANGHRKTALTLNFERISPVMPSLRTSAFSYSGGSGKR
jgi:hypothetical protein